MVLRAAELANTKVVDTPPHLCHHHFLVKTTEKEGGSQCLASQSAVSDTRRSLRRARLISLPSVFSTAGEHEMIHSLGYVGFGSPRHESGSVWHEVLGCQYAGRGLRRRQSDSVSTTLTTGSPCTPPSVTRSPTSAGRRWRAGLHAHFGAPTACGVQATAASADLSKSRQVAALVWS